MKKKIISCAFVLFTGVMLFAPTANAVVAPNGMANQCCDASGTPRCMVPWMPAGAACYCNFIPGQGYAC